MKKNKILDQSKCYKGFTLIESLLVLLIVTIFISLPILQVMNWRERIEYQAFFEEFEQRLIQTQQSAIVCQKETRVLSDQKTLLLHFYFYQEDGRRLIEEMTVPSGIIIQRQTMLSFSGRTGNVKQAHTFRFELNHERFVEYVYQIGSGRFVIKKGEL